MEVLLLSALLAVATGSASAEATPETEEHLYATVLMRAAPGGLMELIELVRKRADVLEAADEPRPLILRHAQGDHWDLMVIQPIGDMTEHFALENVQRRGAAADGQGLSEADHERRLRELVSWREETFYTGPDPATFEQMTAPPAGYFHVEMFVALPRKHAELYRQREMENDYLRRVDRPQNLIFSKTLGGPWDLFTLGLYRDLQHFAARANVPAEVEDQAALAAGFESASMIGPYMRTLIDRHNDTIGGIIR